MVSSGSVTNKRLELLEQSLETITSTLQAEALLSEALMHQQDNQFDKALSAIDQAIELNPKDPWAIAHRGEIYRNR